MSNYCTSHCATLEASHLNFRRRSNRFEAYALLPRKLHVNSGFCHLKHNCHQEAGQNLLLDHWCYDFALHQALAAKNLMLARVTCVL